MLNHQLRDLHFQSIVYRTQLENILQLDIKNYILLHNQDYIAGRDNYGREIRSGKDIRVNDWVEVYRAGDVIPHILSVDIKKRPKKSSKFIFPNKCPSCGSKTVKEFNKTTKKIDAVRRCS